MESIKSIKSLLALSIAGVSFLILSIFSIMATVKIYGVSLLPGVLLMNVMYFIICCVVVFLIMKFNKGE